MSKHHLSLVSNSWVNYQLLESLQLDFTTLKLTTADLFLFETEFAGIVSNTKRYVSVFMITKIVHLKLVEDVTSAAFIGALKRFVSRRGKAVNMYSNNGRNFQGADNELRRLFPRTFRRTFRMLSQKRLT